MPKQGDQRELQRAASQDFAQPYQHRGDELGEQANADRMMPFLVEKYGPAVMAGTLTLHSNRDLGANAARIRRFLDEVSNLAIAVK